MERFDLRRFPFLVFCAAPLLLVLSSAPVPARAADDGSLVLVVNSDDSAFAWARVAPAIEKALAVSVITDADPHAGQRRATLTIAWRPSRHELAVTYEDPRGTISRVVPAPMRGDVDRGIDTAVALAVNLARDQTAELLGKAPGAPASEMPSPPPVPPRTDEPAPAAAIEASPQVAAPAPSPSPRFMVTLVAGTGVGWASGNGDLTGEPASSAGLAWARTAHLVPQLGYFVTPRLLISLQMRLQFISGVSEVHLPDNVNGCGADHICSAPPGAIAGFLKGTWFVAHPSNKRVRSFLSLAVGAGAIRHAAANDLVRICGSSRNEICVDTYSGGPLFLVPGVGLHLRLWRDLDLVLASELALGVPRRTFNVDADVGASFGF